MLYTLAFVLGVQSLNRLVFCVGQWRSRNTEKGHIKGRLLDQAVFPFDCVPFQNENSSLRKEITPSWGEFFPLRAVPYGMEIILPH